MNAWRGGRKEEQLYIIIIQLRKFQKWCLEYVYLKHNIDIK